MKEIYVRHNFSHKFGVELEFTRSMNRDKLKEIIKEVRPKDKILLRGWERNKNNKEWICKIDASCGYEIATPVFKSYKDLNIIDQVVQNLKKHKASIGKKCGIHVHVESKNITTLQLGKIAGYWMKSEDIISAMFPEHRRNNYFCMPLKYKAKINVSKNYSPRELVGILFVNKNKTLNIRGYREKGTIEFRSMESTLNSEDVVNWSRFCVYFTDKIKNMRMPTDLKSYSLFDFWDILGFNDVDGEEVKVFSEDLNNMRLWILKRIKKFSPKSLIVKDARKILKEIKKSIVV